MVYDHQENNKKKGLLVDDEKPILTYLSRLLSSWGYEISTINDSKEVVDVIKKRDFDFILLDVKMPDINGLELYRQIAKIKPAMTKRILFVTGDILERSTSTFLQETQVLNISKPVDTKLLKENINKILAIE